MTKTIITIGTEVPGHSDLLKPYSASQSLFDADIVIFEPNLDSYETDYPEPRYQGKPLYSKDSSFRIAEASVHWQRELKAFLSSGRTVFVIFKKFESFFLHTGKNTYSGTGRNARTTNIVTPANNYQFLPVQFPSIAPAEGKEISASGHPVFASFWGAFKDSLYYESYLDGKVAVPLFLTKTGERAVGALFKVGGGHLVLLPPYQYEHKAFVRSEKGKQFWTKEAVQFGNKFLGVLQEIDKALTGGAERTPAPEWTGRPDLQLRREAEIQRETSAKSISIEKLMAERTDLLKALQEEGRLRDLLYETGKPLEQAVIKALSILGYKAENYNDGSLELDQVIQSPEGVRFIGESEGKDNAAVNVDKLRQLSTNIQEDLQREEVAAPARGILFGNGHRLLDPGQRPGQFTDKCIKAAVAASIVLVSTSDLFVAVKYVHESGDADYAKRCREAISVAVGRVVQFPQIPGQSPATASAVAPVLPAPTSSPPSAS